MTKTTKTPVKTGRKPAAKKVKSVPTTTKDSFRPGWNFKPLIIPAIILGILLIGWLLYDNYIGGPAYRAAKVRCGGEPVAGFTNSFGQGEKYYLLPSGHGYNAPAPHLNKHFCTEQEAIDSGYTRDQYN